MATTMVQINTRVPAELKKQGDLALARAGFTPAQAVRALWEYAATHIHEPQAIRKAIQEEQAESENPEMQEPNPFTEWEKTARNLYKRMGISPDSSVSNLSFDELKELSYQERYGRLGL